MSESKKTNMNADESQGARNDGKESLTMKMETTGTDKEKEKKDETETSPEKHSLGDYLVKILISLEDDKQDSTEKAIMECIAFAMKSHTDIFEKYHVLIQFDDTTMKRVDADNIYASLKRWKQEGKKDILLVLYSFGGDIASGYLISKLCREFTAKKFVVAVPRLAKSAATLICCGADEIHMGSLSELGPIDPQINKLPALGLKNTIKQIAETSSLYPGSTSLFSEYLAKTIKPIDLGYFDRIVESASQYAQRLLGKRCKKLTQDRIKRLADHLVYDYNDHGFVIDKGEAKEIFGDDVIKIDSPEYIFSNAVYSLLSMISNICEDKYKFYFIGSCDLPNSVGLLPRKKC